MDIRQQTMDLIDSLKAICHNSGLGNDGNEYKVIVQVFLYKFLNDKFGYEIKKKSPKIAVAEKWDEAYSALSEDERLDFEAYDISREIENTIDRFAAHPEERAENLPEINQLIFEGPYDDNAKIDVLVILGSRSCGYKAEAAFVIGRKNPGMKYIVSGANLYCSGLCSEAEYLSGRLAEYGVSPSEIYIENHARYTKQNLELSAGILHELLINGTLPGRAGIAVGSSEESKPRVGILTGGFHIPRTRLMAERMSALKDFELIWFPAYGPATQKDTWFETPTGREIVLTELRKTVKLRKKTV